MKLVLHLDENQIAEVNRNFLSVAIDLSQIVGKGWWDEKAGKVRGITGKHNTDKFDFKRKKLIALSRLLSPAYLKISGTMCDEIRYFDDLSISRWDEINHFAKECGFEIIFGLNAGLNVRTKKSWTSDNARRIIEYTKKNRYPVKVWELGNEVNAFFLRGMSWRVSAKQYAKDFYRANLLVKSYSKNYLVAGPSDAFWPIVGGIFSLTKDFLKNKTGKIDIISWHYYPQQSRRSPVATRRAGRYTLLDPGKLDEINKWASKIENWRDKYSKHSEIWLTETGNAQCGGEPGISDSFIGSLWWLDQLGLIAKRGHKVVVRQTLSGSDYGLIDDLTLKPNPDYWASLLWKKLMGEKVYSVSSSDKYVRSYLHETKKDERFMTLLVLNMHRKKNISINIENNIEEYYQISSSLFSKKIFLNGREIDSKKDPIKELRSSKPIENRISLLPCSYAFIVVEKSRKYT